MHHLACDKDANMEELSKPCAILSHKNMELGDCIIIFNSFLFNGGSLVVEKE